MKKISALMIVLLFAFTALAQTTNSGKIITSKPAGTPAVRWVVTSFDSAATVWSPAFSLDGYTASTFDAQGTINLGTVTAPGTYSTYLFLWGCNDDPSVSANWFIVDSLGTITSTNATAFSVDLDDSDQCSFYKFKAYNNGGNNTFTVGLKSEYVP